MFFFYFKQKHSNLMNIDFYFSSYDYFLDFYLIIISKVIFFLRYQLENKTYLLCLLREYAYSKMTRIKLMHILFFSLSIINIYSLNHNQLGIVLRMYMMLFLKILFRH